MKLMFETARVICHDGLRSSSLYLMLLMFLSEKLPKVITNGGGT